MAGASMDKPAASTARHDVLIRSAARFRPPLHSRVLLCRYAHTCSNGVNFVRGFAAVTFQQEVSMKRQPAKVLTPAELRRVLTRQLYPTSKEREKIAPIA
jgi:hypothetical protein